jgi:hypothetical protein
VVNSIGKFLLILIPTLVKGAFTDVNFVLYFFSGVNVSDDGRRLFGTFCLRLQVRSL